MNEAQTRQDTLEDKIRNRKFGEMSEIEMGRLYPGINLSRLTIGELKQLKAAITKFLAGGNPQINLANIYTLVNTTIENFEWSRAKARKELAAFPLTRS